MFRVSGVDFGDDDDPRGAVKRSQTFWPAPSHRKGISETLNPKP